MSRIGPSGTIGRAQIRDMQIGNRTQIFIGRSVASTPGSVREDVLVWVRRRYHQVDGYQEMATILEERRVLLLRGLAGTGRFTTGLHLLDRVTSTGIFRVDGKKIVSDLGKGDFPKKTAGYVSELSRHDAISLSEETLDKLRDVMEEQSAFCVLISDNDTRDLAVLGGYAMAYEPPNSAALLRKHTAEGCWPTIRRTSNNG